MLAQSPSSRPPPACAKVSPPTASTLNSTSPRPHPVTAFDDDDNSLLLTRCIEKAIEYILDRVGVIPRRTRRCGREDPTLMTS